MFRGYASEKIMQRLLLPTEAKPLQVGLQLTACTAALWKKPEPELCF